MLQRLRDFYGLKSNRKRLLPLQNCRQELCEHNLKQTAQAEIVGGAAWAARATGISHRPCCARLRGMKLCEICSGRAHNMLLQSLDIMWLLTNDQLRRLNLRLPP